MIHVQEAVGHISSTHIHIPISELPLEEALGKVLAQPLTADRDFPPYHRVTMDGIAIAHEDWTRGLRTFRLTDTQLAGSVPKTFAGPGTCIEVMTGAVLPPGTDTVIKVEELKWEKEGDSQQVTLLSETLTKGLNVHTKGTDRKAQDQLVSAGTLLGPAEIAVAATIGATHISVKHPLKVAVVSSGDELVDISDTPLPHQIRKSNSYMLQAALQSLGVSAERTHLPDNPDAIKQRIAELLEDNQVIIMTGGVSKGKADYVPGALDALGVEKIFHKIQQRPGKPFWFGRHPQNKVVFALPGNPVSSFIGFYRYIKPWISKQMGMNVMDPLYAQLAEPFHFAPDLTYFLLVNASVNEKGTYIARPIPGSGSGDHANLLRCNAFLELPFDRTDFKAGEVFPMWRYR